MAKVLPEIDSQLAAWIAQQPLFFVASAPLIGEGHVNLSPRGLDTLRLLGPHEAAFYDLNGSGNETAAHLAENGRITLMFCAFSGAPRILRLYGRGEVVRPGDGDWTALRRHFGDALPAARQIIRIAVTRVQSSCGYGVPLMALQGQRDELVQWSAKKGEAGLLDYQRQKNHQSIDGLPAPGITPLQVDNGE
ncbi:MAG: pyridoxamine 5'-phosphate oxidase family protein [Gammaproteobacteria bacterium]|nr:pyridoxamine 5'-phosphate oxidase family protein [Gammaproteobacteria bacterium]